MSNWIKTTFVTQEIQLNLIERFALNLGHLVSAMLKDRFRSIQNFVCAFVRIGDAKC